MRYWRSWVKVVPLRLLFLICLTACACSAQPYEVVADETARAQRLLGSQRWVDKAWGAHLAGRLRLSALRDLLILELRNAEPFRSARFDGEEYAYVQSLFDALIEMAGPVPADVIVPFESRWRAEVLILLSRAEGHDALLAMLDEQLEEAEWIAVNNLLLRMRSPQFFKKTLEELQITHRFILTDTDGTGFGSGGGVGGAACGARQFPAGFPPTALYQLHLWPMDGDVLFATGPHDVYYRRLIVPTNRPVGWSKSVGKGDRQQYCLEYLARLANLSVDQAQRLFRRVTTVRWQNADQASREVDLQLAGQETEIRDFIANATRLGLGEVTGLRLQIKPEIVDQRQTVKEGPPLLTPPREIVLN